MLRYLDNDGQPISFNQALEAEDIDISVLTFKVGRRVRELKSKSLSEEADITHTLDADWIKTKSENLVHQKPNAKKDKYDSTKPTFDKLPQVDCFDIVEVEEQESSFCSNDLDNSGFSRNIKSEIDDIGRKTTSDCQFKVKSPSYFRSSYAERKIKESILN